MTSLINDLLRVIRFFTEQNFCDVCIEDNVKIFPVESRLEERLGRAEPLALLDGGLKVGKAEVVLAVDVQDFVAPTGDCLEKCIS